VVSDEEAAQEERFHYLCSHGVKENLVGHLRDWPGLHCIRQIVDGEPLTGTWYDRTQEYIARRLRGEDPDPLRFTTRETVTLTPLPCWKHLSPEAYRQRVANLAREIEEEAAETRKRTGAQSLGRKTVLAQDPLSRPKKLKKSPAPLFHAATKAMRRYLWEGYAWFVAAYRTAAEKLQQGDPDPGFPPGSLPPAMPFVSG
jgi:hypothetical protein